MPADPPVAADLVDELRLRRWARENYVAPELRDPTWPEIIDDEMRRIDAERDEIRRFAATGQRIVPLAPETDWRLHPPHDALVGPPIVIRVPVV